jgi:hemolysin activation/secretion protein
MKVFRKGILVFQIEVYIEYGKTEQEHKLWLNNYQCKSVNLGVLLQWKLRLHLTVYLASILAVVIFTEMNIW